MTDAREWLTGTAWATDDGVCAMRDALLAVLDECDEPGGEADALALAFGSGAYPGIWYDALALASGRIHAAIDKALGVSDG